MKANKYCESGCNGTLKKAEHKSITVYHRASGGMFESNVWGSGTMGVSASTMEFIALRSCTNL